MSASLTIEKYLWRYGRFLSLTRLLMLIGQQFKSYCRKIKSGIICVRKGSLKRTEIYYHDILEIETAHFLLIFSSFWWSTFFSFALTEESCKMFIADYTGLD